MFSVRSTKLCVYLGAEHAQAYVQPAFGLGKWRAVPPVPRSELATVLRDSAPRARQIDWLLATALCRFTPLPTEAAVRNDAEAALIASATMERKLGLHAREWQVAVEPMWRSATPLACAVRKADLAFAQAICEALKLRCGRVQTWLGLALRRLPNQAEDAWLFEEPDAVSAVRATAEGWQILSAPSHSNATVQHAMLAQALGIPIAALRPAQRNADLPVAVRATPEGTAT